MTFRGKEIYNCLKKLVKKSLAILNRNGLEYMGDLNLDVDLKDIPPISFLLNDEIRRQIASKIEEIKKTEEFAYTYNLVSKIPTPQSNSKSEKNDDIQFLGLEATPAEVEDALRKQQFETDLFYFLIAYCNLKRDLEFDETVFNALYKRFEDKLYGKNYIMALCPLKKFYLETDELVFDAGIKIRRISKEELLFINKEMAGGTLKELDAIQFTIEYTYDVNEFKKRPDVDDWDWSPWQDATLICEKKFIEIVALLRLFKEGDFHNPLENFQLPCWGVVPMGVHFNLCDREIRGGRNYTLDREETEGFKEFYRKSLKFSNDKRMFIALERFNLAYEKKRFEDNIIDYVIAFEALFGTKEKSRAGMRIKLKSGFLIEDSKEKIIEIYKFMRDVYELRSTIVHGDEIQFPLTIGEEDYYSENQVKSAILNIFRKIISSFFNEERRRDKEKVFAIIEEQLKLEENENKSGEQVIELIIEMI